MYQISFKKDQDEEIKHWLLHNPMMEICGVKMVGDEIVILYKNKVPVDEITQRLDEAEKIVQKMDSGAIGRFIDKMLNCCD